MRAYFWVLGPPCIHILRPTPFFFGFCGKHVLISAGTRREFGHLHSDGVIMGEGDQGLRTAQYAQWYE